jgi:nicotinate-nucleotide pyrophosphorylase (carboxylating)
LTTYSLISNNKNITACIIAKENGIVAGLEEFAFLNKDLKLEFFKNDGSKIKNGDIIAKIGGSAKKILSRERTNLNLLQRMSGIATLTCELNEKLNNNIKIAATRKTLWGLLDKKAVGLGGGLTHRLNLSDGIVIKDNHLKILNYGIEKALNILKNKPKCIEIEVESKKQALNAANIIKKTHNKNRKNLFAIMLDKIPPKETKLIIKNLKKRGLYDYVLLEASGNIKEDNLLQYKDCGADVISMGLITNSAKALNMSTEIK